LSSRSPSSVALLARVIVLTLCCSIAIIPYSHAQNTGGFPGFLQNLFGFKPQPQQAPPANQPLKARAHPRKKQDFVSTAVTRKSGSAAGAPARPIFFVSVLGDSLGMLAAQGLSAAFSDKPEISIADVARDLSGLTRDDYYDWPKAAHDLAVGKQKIDVAVVMVGINDLQPLKEDGETLDTLSDKWRAVYAQRVEKLVSAFHEAHIPVLWVGLPPTSDDRFNAQAIALNEIFREHVEKAGGKYVDIWDAFADQNGQFAAFGPDIDGQNTKLRSGPNGIYFTEAGSRKLAHFLESDIRRAFDRTRPQTDIAALPPDIEQQADDINAEIRREMGAEISPGNSLILAPRPAAGPILSLTARPTAANGRLVGTLGGLGVDTWQDEGALGSPEPRPGRADDFNWPRSQ